MWINITLTAGNGFTSYQWRNGAGTVIGNTQSITVNTPGTYIVTKTAPAPCVSFDETIDVIFYGPNTTNPIIPFADEVVTCVNDGSQLPKIYLCGLNDERFLNLNLTDASVVNWQQLVEGSCTLNTLDNCPNTNENCSWNTIATGSSYNVSTEGEYRIEIIYQNGCPAYYYFKVYTNPLNPDVRKQDILCGNDGEITVINVPSSDYEFQLINQATNAVVQTWQTNPTFNVSTPGAYTVEIRQTLVTNGCTFYVRDIGILERDFNVNVIKQDVDCTNLGSIRLQANNALPQYYYELYTNSNTLIASHGPSDDNDYTFTGLNPGDYRVRLYTDNGCEFDGTVTINNLNNLALIARTSQHITCKEGNIQMQSTGGLTPHLYAIWNYTPENGALKPAISYADYASIPNSAWQSSQIFDIPIGAQGTYQFIVVDRNGCFALSNLEDIELIPPIEYTVKPEDIKCYGESTGSIGINIISAGQGGYKIKYELVAPDGTILTTNSGTYGNLAAGQYELIVYQFHGSFDADGACIFRHDITINQPDSPLTGQAEITTTLKCDPTNAIVGATLTAINVSGGTAPYQYSINGIDFSNTTGVFNNLSAGTYTLTIRDANGCIITDTETIQALNPPTDLTITATTPTCPALSSDVNLTVIGGTAPYIFEIIAPTSEAINNGSNPLFPGLTAGTYTFRVTDSNGCYYEENYTIDRVVPIDIIGQTTKNIDCFGTASGEALFTVSGFSTTYSYILNSNPPITGQTSSNISLTGLLAGTYTITVTDELTGCTDQATIEIETPTTALSLTVSNTPITCISDASIQASATGGWGGFEYSLQLPDGSVIGPQNNGIFNNLTQEGQYIVTVTDINGCIETSQITLETPVPITASLLVTDWCVDANGASFTVTAAGGQPPYLYSFSGSTPSANNTFTNLPSISSGPVKVIDAYGCWVEIEVPAFQDKLIAIASLTKDLDCSPSPDGNIEVTINGGYQPYTYEVNYNGGGYNGTPITAGATTFNYPVVNPGTYQFKIVDEKGCETESNIITVTPKVSPSITAVTQIQPILCHGDASGAIEIEIDRTTGLLPFDITITGQTTGHTETITDSFDYEIIFSGLPADTYDIILQDAKGCQAVHSITISEPDPITFDLNQSYITCIPGGTSLGEIIIENVIGGTAPYTYYWRNNFGSSDFYPALSAENHTFTVIDYGFYEVEIVDANGCSTIKSLTMASPPNGLEINISTTAANCITGATATVTVISSIGSNNYEFAILEFPTSPYANPSNYLPPTAPSVDSHTFTGLIPGVEYTFVVYDKDTNCYFLESANIPPLAAPSIEVSALTHHNISCTGANDGSIDFTVSGYDVGATGIHYEIFYSSSILSTGIYGTITPTGTSTTLNNIGPLDQGSYYIVVQEIGGPNDGCKNASQQFSILESTIPLEVEANAIDNDNCHLNAGKVHAIAQHGTGPYQYIILSDTATAPDETNAAWSSVNLFNVEAGNYIVYAMDAYGCIVNDPVVVEADPTIDISLSIVDDCVVEGNFEVLVHFANATDIGVAPYSISINGGVFQQITMPYTITGLSSGLLTVVVRDSNGCDETETLTVLKPLGAYAVVTNQPSCLNNDGELQVNASGGSGNFEYIAFNITTSVSYGPQPNGLFTGLSAGQYEITITDTSTACPITLNATLEEPIPVIFNAIPTDVNCFGGSDGTITIELDPSNTDTPYTYSVNDGTSTITQTNPVFTGLSAGTYTVTVTSGKNCSDSKTVSINQPTNLTATAIATDFACDPDNTVLTSEITVTASGGTAPYLYSIDNVNFGTSNIFQIVDNGSVQTPTIYVRDANGCVANDTVIINPLPEITAVLVSQNTAITCINDEEVTVTITGGSGNFEVTLLPNGPTQIINGNTATFTINSAGSYTFQVTDLGTLCYFITQPYIINPYDTIAATATTASDVTCFGDNNGSVSLNVSGYTGNYNYNLLDSSNNSVATGTENTATNPIVITGLNGGIYTILVTATDAPYCDAITNTFTIRTPSTPLAVTLLKTADVTCSNDQGEIQAIATGGWGSYTFRFTNITSGTPVLLQDFNANNYLTGLDAGTYEVTVRDANGCEETDTVELEIPIPITATIAASHTTLDCFGDTNASISVTASGGSGIYEYKLQYYDSNSVLQTSPIQLSPIFNNLGAGTYSVIVSDTWSCEVQTIELTIAEPTEVQASLVLDAQVTCTTDARLILSATGGTGPYEFSSSQNGPFIPFASGTSHTFTNVTPGTYQYYIRDSFGCVGQVSNQLVVDPVTPLEIHLDLTAAIINCTGQFSADIYATATGGLGNYQYELLDDPSAMIPIAGPQPTGLFTGLPAGTYYIQVTSEDCAEVSSPVVITDPDPLETVTNTFTNVTCFGDNDGTITVEMSGGTGIIKYAISPSLDKFDTINHFTDLAPGNYTVVAQDANGCYEVFDFTITQPDLLEVVSHSVTDEICFNAMDGTATITLTGGTAPYYVSLNSSDPSDFIEIVGDTYTFTGLIPGVHFIFYKDANDCEHYLILDEILPGVELTPTYEVDYNCTANVPGNVLTISVNPNVVADVTYSLNGGTPQQSNIFTDVPHGNHIITVSHSNGCREDLPIIIEEKFPLLMDSRNSEDVSCFGGNDGSIQLVMSGGNGLIEYELSSNLGVWVTSGTFTNLIAGNYTIRVRDEINCELEFNFTINEPLELTASITASTNEICLGDANGTATINVTGGTAPYQTSLNSNTNYVTGQFDFTGLTVGPHTIYVRDANNCETSVQVIITEGVDILPSVDAYTVDYNCMSNVPGNILTINVNTSVVGDVTFSLNGGTPQQSNIFTDVAAGSHTVTINHINGCSVPLEVIIEAKQPLLLVSSDFTNVLCNGGNDGSITLVMSGGNGTIEYELSSNPGVWVTSGIFNGLTAGNYTVNVRDEINCTQTYNFTINQPTSLNSSIVSIQPEICAGDRDGSAQITVSGGTAPYSTRLNTQSNFVQGQFTFNNLAGGNYTVFIRDANNCEITLPVTIDYGANLTANVQVTYGCENNMPSNTVIVNIDPTVIGDVVFTLNGVDQYENIFYNVPPGPQIIEILHPNGCYDVVTFSINDIQPLTLQAVQNNINQITAIASGGAGGYQYYFNDRPYGTKNTYYINQSGWYDVKVVDANGCEAYAQIYMEFIDICIPDHFTPNQDGNNDSWSPCNTEGFPNIYTKIYDRYGRQVALLRVGDSWDGTYNGQELPTGDYWYVIKLKGENDPREFVGHFTLYR